jgi:Ssp1 endopeptidase immunity protein Rap1a
MRITKLLVLLSGLAVSANAQVAEVMISSRFGTAERLVAACKKVENLDAGRMTAPDKEHYDIGLCSGFVIGVIDAETYRAEVFRSVGQKDAHPAECVPSTATVTQLAKVIVKYGDDHPNELHTAAVDFVHGALMSSFPCK